LETNEQLTQKFSSWGDKLLQHTDVLYSIQKDKKFKPVTVQIALTEVCNSRCPFCSVAGRPVSSHFPFSDLAKCLRDFKELGAKSVEITGGGNPLLYKDSESGADVNNVIELAFSLGFDIGIITNSCDLKKISPQNYDKITWMRVSLIQLDEGKSPEDYHFYGFPIEKLGFSYIIYDGTSEKSIQKILCLVNLHPGIKFVRIAGNCLVKGNNQKIKEKYTNLLSAIDAHHKIFIKDIGENDSPFNDGCYIGAIRPYIAPHPKGIGYKYQVYVCTSHVLNDRNYDLDYSLGEVSNVKEIWENMNNSFSQRGFPYEIKKNCGKNWDSSCRFCFYYFNNKLLHSVSQEMPDKNFP
jgi:hypothetical protein